MADASVTLLLNIDVPDLEAAQRFYVEALGLRVGRRLGESVVELLGAGVPLYLLQKPPGSPYRENSASENAASENPASEGPAAQKPAAASSTPTAPPAATAASLRRTYERHWTPLHLDVVVTDVAAARARALTLGARAEGPVSEHPWGYLALLCDPFGHGLCLIQLRGRGYDEIATR